MILKRKRFIKRMSLCLAAILMLGSFGVYKITSKADLTDKNEVTKNDAYEKFIQNYRKEGVEITITSLDELYDEFNSYDNVNELVRENVLAKASDEIIIQFLLEEEKEFYRINEEVKDKSVFSDSLEENVETNHGDYLKDINIEYYKKGEDSYKKVTTITSKYGGKFEVISIDGAENDNNMRGFRKFTKIGTPRDELTFKEYGDRYFTYSIKSFATKMTATFRYTLSYGRIDVRDIEGFASSACSPIEKIVVESQNITNSVADNMNEKIKGSVIYELTAASAFFGGYEFEHIKINMSVEKLADSKSTWKCGMNIRQCAQAYEEIF